MSTGPDPTADLPSANPARSRRQALKVMGTALAGGLAAFLGTRSGRDRPGSAQGLAPQRATSLAARRPERVLPPAQDPEQTPDARPNILFILGDNHNYETMGCAGHPFIETPGMDRIAREGVLFDNTFNTTALCSPSRASILTGAYARNHEVKNNHTPWTGQMTTFLELLSQGGYDTAFIGKWHMPGEGLPEMPFLDLFVSYTYREGQGAYFNCPMIVNGVETPSRTPYISEEDTNYALEFIQDNLDKAIDERPPFCIYLSHRAGHPPFQSPEDIKGMYDEASIEGIIPDHVDPWWYGKANRNVFQGVMMGSYYDQYRRYCETLTAMDRDIVRLLMDDARRSNKSVAAEVGIAASTLSERLHRLRRSGVFRGFHADVDPAVLWRLCALVMRPFDYSLLKIEFSGTSTGKDHQIIATNRVVSRR